jgi:FdhE protein
MARAGWVEAHPYLEPLARFVAQVDSAWASIDVAEAHLPCWEEYLPDFQDGVPLLHSEGAAIDREPAGEMARALVASLAGRPLPETLAQGVRSLDVELPKGSAGARRVLDCLFGDATDAAAAPGLLRYLGWTAAARHLRPVVKAFESWRDEERWLKNHCPTCGSAPAMAQLIGVDPARLRLLVCGCCGTRWRYRRTICPFCEADAQRLAVVAVEDERRLRIDFCESCRGYLKAYVGEGEEALFLSDWTSLYLDVVAADRGLKRLAASLYDLP